MVAPLTRGKFPIIIDYATTITTPGESIDVVVTDGGICVNPKNKELRSKLIDAGLTIVDIQDLQVLAQKRCGPHEPPPWKERIVAVQEYCDGTVIDIIRKIQFVS